ncbi:MAG: YceI family protein [Hyphomicrobiales bacterium]|nr:YceI family protein [Hyphomicrobiales bacterium]
MIRLAFAALIAMTAHAFAADTYVFDKKHTEIRFTWDHFGLSRTAAYVKDYDGELTFDAAAPEKSALSVTIPTKNIQAVSLGAESFLAKPEWFDAEKFPQITFKSTKIEKTGEKTGKIMGDLTIKGVTKPVVLDATLNFKGEHPFSKKPAVGVSAKTTVKRSDFNMGAYAPAISDAIEISIETEMTKK